jgi:alcohol dehydrogenase class IV
MSSLLIIYSKHTKHIAINEAKRFKDVEFLEVAKDQYSTIINMKTEKDFVMGIGGGSILDISKIIAQDRRCLVIPTTAAGASSTAFATVWREIKDSVKTQTPILLHRKNQSINLPHKVLISTICDALAHAIESFWSKNANNRSKRLSRKAIKYLMKYFKKQQIEDLIKAGVIAGEAINITKTNIIHAISYPLTIHYDICHGLACGYLLIPIINYVNDKRLPKLFGFKNKYQIISFIRKNLLLERLKIKKPELLANLALKYLRIHESPKKVDKRSLINVLSDM